ncbi:hypothetical protein [Mesorhizobium sp. LSJC264A00]|uniref:hypothetical protein n=1 Tax=unclassified Mesorhizobium TaxID=325217 RepID=UPI0003CF174C|nr:hypothetical protein [Mesorhizobium sp. LSJC264A00]ESX23299.1 hypothetical protein X767_15895 [Mesorhizobium sp. LSJC264A00]
MSPDKHADGIDLRPILKTKRTKTGKLSGRPVKALEPDDGVRDIPSKERRRRGSKQSATLGIVYRVVAKRAGDSPTSRSAWLVMNDHERFPTSADKSAGSVDRMKRFLVDPTRSKPPSANRPK